jgi:hypothetical protein
MAQPVQFGNLEAELEMTAVKTGSAVVSPGQFRDAFPASFRASFSLPLSEFVVLFLTLTPFFHIYPRHQKRSKRRRMAKAKTSRHFASFFNSPVRKTGSAFWRGSLVLLCFHVHTIAGQLIRYSPQAHNYLHLPLPFPLFTFPSFPPSYDSPMCLTRVHPFDRALTLLH